MEVDVNITPTGWVIAITGIVWLVYDVWVYAIKKDPINYPTLSKVIAQSSWYSPIIPFIFGALCGHFFM